LDEDGDSSGSAMPKARFTQAQIMTVLNEIDEGQTVRAVSRKYGISINTVYRWRARRRDTSEITRDRLRTLEVENRRLKSKFAELALDYTSLRAALIKDVKREC
jgi:putative transposase